LPRETRKEILEREVISYVIEVGRGTGEVKEFEIEMRNFKGYLLEKVMVNTGCERDG